MKDTPLFILTIALFTGFLTSFYKIPLWFALLFLPLAFFLFDFRKALILIFLFLSFYTLGNFYFYKREPLSKENKERFLLKIERVEPYFEGYRVFARVKDSVLIEFTTKKKRFKPGSICEVSLTKKRWYERWNPFSPEESNILQIREVEGVFKLDESGRIYCVEDDVGFFENIRFKLFQFSEGLSPLARGLFLALVLGVENQLPSEYLESLRNQGLYHQLAISGFNLAVLYGLLYKFFRWFLGYTRFLKLEIPLQILAYLLALPGAFLILIFSGFQPPTMRAFFFLLIYLLNKILFRATPSLLILFLAGDTLLLFNPSLIGNVSFQLSFLATLALFLGDRIFNERFSKEIPSPFLKNLLQGLFISVLVSLFLFPLIVEISGEFPLATPINNLIATPFWSLLFIPLSIFAALLSFFSQSLATLIMEFTAQIFSLYQRIPFFEFILRPSLPVNILFFWCLLSIVFGIILWKIKIRNYYKVVIFLALYGISYFLLKGLYFNTSFIFLPKLFTMRAYVIKDSQKFYLITEESERSYLERKTLFIPLLKKFGIKEFEGVLFLEETPLEDYQKNFHIKEVYQQMDLLLQKERIFKEGPEFILLSPKAYLIEFKGFSLIQYRGSKKPEVKAEFYLNSYIDIKKRKASYFFFVKENYILLLNERERRRDFLTLLLFPLSPYYLEKEDILKVYYFKEP